MKICATLLTMLAGVSFAVSALAADGGTSPALVSPGVRSVVNTSASPHVKFQNPDLGSVRWTEGFWRDRFDLCRQVTIPTMFEVMQKPDNSANRAIPGKAA